MNPKGQDDAVRRELELIGGSATFRQVDRLKRFLEFIVLETVAGRGNQLKEYVVGVQVFDKDTNFDPRTDPIVRVQARRLRSRLARYYADEGQQSVLVIELPKGGYTPSFRRNEVVATKRSVAGALARQNTVSVAPFDDQSEDGDLGYFCGGLGQEIVHRMIGSETLRVLAWEHKADAAMIVCGSVRKAKSRVRVSVQLIDGASGAYLWSEVLDGEAADALDIQGRAAQAVVAKLDDSFGPNSLRRGFPRAAENLAARNLYLQGRYHLNQRSEESLRKAVEFFEKAIVEDGRFAQAHSGLADAYSLLGHYGVLAPAEVWTKTASSAASAVILDESCVESRTSLAHVRSTQDWDWLEAEREFRRAISLDPRHATAHHWYAVSCLAPMGRLDEALEEILIAQSLDPVSSIIGREVAVIHYYRRDFDTALENIDHTVELNPHFSPAYWTLGLIQEQRGDLDESMAAFQRAVQLSPGNPRMKGALGRAYALSGKRGEALGILEELRGVADRRYVSPFDLASMHFALGDEETGFQWLTKAFEDRCFELLSIRVDPRFDLLRTNPRLEELARRLGLARV